MYKTAFIFHKFVKIEILSESIFVTFWLAMTTTVESVRMSLMSGSPSVYYCILVIRTIATMIFLSINCINYFHSF